MEVAEAQISREIIATLHATLKSWGPEMDAFRYSMFARRLVAAEYGRPDAVEWALNWHKDLLAEERRNAQEMQERIDAERERQSHAKAEFNAGRCGNPIYQVFLDTVEHPERLSNNVPYFEWLSKMNVKFATTPDLRKMTDVERSKAWKTMLETERAANLAPRLRNAQ